MGVVDGANMRLSLHTEVLKWPLAHNESMYDDAEVVDFWSLS